MLYEKLSKELSDEHADVLEEYVEAANATVSRREILTYIQGMKDMYNMSLALQSKE